MSTEQEMNRVYSNRILLLEDMILNELGYKGIQPKRRINKLLRNRDLGWKIIKDFNDKGNYITGVTIFGVKDELKPLDDYLNDIVNSVEFLQFKIENGKR